MPLDRRESGAFRAGLRVAFGGGELEAAEFDEVPDR